MKELLSLFQNRFSAKGGGSDKMIQGTLAAKETEIMEFISLNIDKK